MNRRLPGIFLPLLCSTIVFGSILFPDTARGQTPDDLEILATAGSWSAFAENRSVLITRDGKIKVARYIPDAFGTDDAEVDSLTVSGADLLSIWQSVQDQGFFSMESTHVDEESQDGTFAWLTVTANADTHHVLTRNVALPAFDAILSTINTYLPENQTLIYNTEPPETYPVVDICDRYGKTAGQVSSLFDLKKRNHPTDAAISTVANDVHPGTVVSHKISLLEAAKRGLVRLEGKGGYMGDKVSLTANNSSSNTTETVTVDLYLEFRGVGIYAEKKDITRVKNAIESHWNGKRTSDGKLVEVKVHEKIAGWFSGATPGYHQVQMTSTEEGSVIGLGQTWEVNRGTGKAVLGSSEDPSMEATYAHEAGHLMGLPDKYSGYSKQIDNTWKDEKTGEVFATTQIAAKMAQRDPLWSALSIFKRISNPMVKRACIRHAGHETDLMADLRGSVRQTAIDAIATNRGLTVSVKPGTILVNKENSDQNLVVTRDTPLFIRPGETKRINGLWTACIDGHEGVPGIGQRFDVAPPLEQWAGIEAADILLEFLTYVDSLGVFCDWSLQTQRAIWRITDNSAVGDVAVDTLLANAGIDLGARLLDFPRMSSPAPDDTTSVALIPMELFQTEITPETSLVGVGASVDAMAGLVGPTIENAGFTCDWTLRTPEFSNARIEGSGAGDVRFVPDVRGIYLADVDCRFIIAGDSAWLPTQTMRVIAADDATDTFERSDLYGNPLFAWIPDPTAPWLLAGDNPHTGNFAAQSAPLDNSGTSRLEILLNVPRADSISFAFSTSSEEGFDIFAFSVDGTTLDAWSGERDWNVATFDIPAGTPTLTWSYSKDGSISSGDDLVWIDDVFFPPGSIPVSISQVPPAPMLGTQLLHNYPNPSDRSTSVTYALADPSEVTLSLFDVTGRMVRRFETGHQAVGLNQLKIRTEDLPSGVYFFRMTAGEIVSTRRMIVRH